MSSILKKQSIKKRILLLTLIALMVAAFAMPMSVNAAPVGITYISYEVSSSSVYTEESQEDIVTFTYPGAVTFDTGVESDFSITIAGSNINPDRPLMVSASANVLTLTIGPSTSGTTANMNAIITIDTTNLHVYSDGVQVDDITGLVTIIPTEIALTYGVGSSTVSLDQENIQFTARAQVRSMNHIGIYTDDGKNLTPVWYDSTSAGNIKAYTYTIHSHSFTTQQVEDYAEALYTALTTTTAFIDSPYKAIYTSGSDTVSFVRSDLTSLAGDNIVVAVFDDDFLQAHGTTYEEVIQNNGVVPS